MGLWTNCGTNVEEVKILANSLRRWIQHETETVRSKKIRRQDEFTRYRRLSQGRCPTHGIQLIHIGVVVNSGGKQCGPVLSCPRKDCDFKTEVREGTRLHHALDVRRRACV
jgi:hypothetical protein